MLGTRKLLSTAVISAATSYEKIFSKKQTTVTIPEIEWCSSKELWKMDLYFSQSVTSLASMNFSVQKIYRCVRKYIKLENSKSELEF